MLGIAMISTILAVSDALWHWEPTWLLMFTHGVLVMSWLVALGVPAVVLFREIASLRLLAVYLCAVGFAAVTVVFYISLFPVWQSFARFASMALAVPGLVLLGVHEAIVQQPPAPFAETLNNAIKRLQSVLRNKPVVFISYRVQANSGDATAIDGALSGRFGASRVFLAPRTIEPGSDFVDSLERTVPGCAVLLAVIGSDWVRKPDEQSSDKDYVYWEIERAFAAGVRVIPVLIDAAVMPDKRQLPPEIADLSQCQAIPLRHSTYTDDIKNLVDRLHSMFPELGAPRTQP